MEPEDIVRFKSHDFHLSVVRLPRHQRIIIALSIHILRSGDPA